MYIYERPLAGCAADWVPYEMYKSEEDKKHHALSLLAQLRLTHIPIYRNFDETAMACDDEPPLVHSFPFRNVCLALCYILITILIKRFHAGFLLSPDLTECHQQVMLISKLQDIALTNWGEVTWRNYLEKTLDIL